jgi:hypothetical protein
MSRRLLVAIVLISVAVALLVVANMGGARGYQDRPPKPTVDPATACATGTLVECSAACGELSGRIRWTFDETERKALEQQYQQDCSQFGPRMAAASPRRLGPGATAAATVGAARRRQERS